MKMCQILRNDRVKCLIKKFKEKNGLAQIPLMIGLLLVAVAIPVATNLVQKNQENRSKATDMSEDAGGSGPAGTRCCPNLGDLNPCGPGYTCSDISNDRCGVCKSVVTNNTYSCNRCSGNNGCERVQFTSSDANCENPVGDVTRTTDCSCPRMNGAGGGNDSRCDNECSNIGGTGGGCTDDLQCPNNQVCKSGSCVTPEPGASCERDTQCIVSEKCVDGTCKAPQTYTCPTSGIAGYGIGEAACYSKSGNGNTCGEITQYTGYKYTNAGSCESTSICCKKECAAGYHSSGDVCVADVVTVPPCTSHTYSGWGACSSSGTQTRTLLTSLPTGCQGGVAPELSKTCTPPTTTVTVIFSDLKAVNISRISAALQGIIKGFNAGDVKQYWFEYGQNNFSKSSVKRDILVPGTGVNEAITDLLASTEYSYRLAAIDKNNQTHYSETLKFTTTNAQLTCTPKTIECIDSSKIRICDDTGSQWATSTCPNGCSNNKCNEVTTCARCTTSLASKGDANCDGKISVLDFSVWFDEFKKKILNKSDFNCNSTKEDLNDFSIWNDSFIKSR